MAAFSFPWQKKQQPPLPPGMIQDNYGAPLEDDAPQAPKPPQPPPPPMVSADSGPTPPGPLQAKQGPPPPPPQLAENTPPQGPPTPPANLGALTQQAPPQPPQQMAANGPDPSPIVQQRQGPPPPPSDPDQGAVQQQFSNAGQKQGSQSDYLSKLKQLDQMHAEAKAAEPHAGKWGQALQFALTLLTKDPRAAEALAHPNRTRQENEYQQQRAGLLTGAKLEEQDLMNQERRANLQSLADARANAPAMKAEQLKLQQEKEAREAANQRQQRRNDLLIHRGAQPYENKATLTVPMPFGNMDYQTNKPMEEGYFPEQVGAETLAVPTAEKLADIEAEKQRKIIESRAENKVTPSQKIQEEMQARHEQGIALGLKGDELKFYTVNGKLREPSPNIHINVDQGEKMLSPNEAITLGVPYGTTKAQAAAMGIQPSKALSPDQQRRIDNAQLTAQAVPQAIQAIKEFSKKHPDLVASGGLLDNPVHNLAARAKNTWQEKTNSEPADLGGLDSLLESVALFQPPQHNMRSIQALHSVKQAIGVDPRTGKPDGSRAWQRNPQKLVSALEQLMKTNEEIGDVVSQRNKAMPPSAPQAPKAPKQADPLGIR